MFDFQMFYSVKPSIIHVAVLYNMENLSSTVPCTDSEKRKKKKFVELIKSVCCNAGDPTHKPYVLLKSLIHIFRK